MRNINRFTPLLNNILAQKLHENFKHNDLHPCLWRCLVLCKFVPEFLQNGRNSFNSESCIYLLSIYLSTFLSIYLSNFLIISCVYLFENSNFQCYFRMDDVILTYAFGFLNNQNTMMRDRIRSCHGTIELFVSMVYLLALVFNKFQNIYF